MGSSKKHKHHGSSETGVNDRSLRRTFVDGRVDQARAVCLHFGVRLPKFAAFSPAHWEHQKEDGVWETVRECSLGWSVTDYGTGDWKRGRTSFTLRNGMPGSNLPVHSLPYCERLVVLEKGQRSPMHAHMNRHTDIINRSPYRQSADDQEGAGQEGAGEKPGVIVVQLAAAKAATAVAVSPRLPVSVTLDGQAKLVSPMEPIRLPPGSSLSIGPGVFHSCWLEEGGWTPPEQLPAAATAPAKKHRKGKHADVADDDGGDNDNVVVPVSDEPYLDATPSKKGSRVKKRPSGDGDRKIGRVPCALMTVITTACAVSRDAPDREAIDDTVYYDRVQFELRREQAGAVDSDDQGPEFRRWPAIADDFEPRYCLSHEYPRSASAIQVGARQHRKQNQTVKFGDERGGSPVSQVIDDGLGRSPRGRRRSNSLTERDTSERRDTEPHNPLRRRSADTGPHVGSGGGGGGLDSKALKRQQSFHVAENMCTRCGEDFIAAYVTVDRGPPLGRVEMGWCKPCAMQADRIVATKTQTAKMLNDLLKKGREQAALQRKQKEQGSSGPSSDFPKSPRRRKSRHDGPGGDIDDKVLAAAQVAPPPPPESTAPALPPVETGSSPQGSAIATDDADDKASKSNNRGAGSRSGSHVSSKNDKGSSTSKGSKHKDRPEKSPDKKQTEDRDKDQSEKSKKKHKKQKK